MPIPSSTCSIIRYSNMFHQLENVSSLIGQIVDAQSDALAIMHVNGECLFMNAAYSELADTCSDVCAEFSGTMQKTPLFHEDGTEVAYLLQFPLSNEHSYSAESANESRNLSKDQFTILNRLTANMLTYKTLDPLLQRIADIVIEVTEASNVLILMVDETEEFLDVVASAGPTSHRNIGIRREYGVGFAGLAWSTKKEQYLENCDSLDSTKGFWPAGSQLVAVPLMSNKTVIGVVVLSGPADTKDFRTSTGLVSYLASLASIAIVHARSNEQHELELSRMRALRQINHFLMDFDSPTDLVQSVSKTLMNAMDISRVVYFVVEEDGKTEHADVWVKEEGIIKKGESIVRDIMNEGLNGWCYQNNEPAFIPRNHEDSRESLRVRKARIETNIGSTYCVPISSKDTVVGVISISRDLSKRDLSENERHLFLSICAQISSVLLNKELSIALHHRAFHDSLTELPNRYLFENELENDLLNAAEDEISAVMFLDFDGFKTVNDSLGHHYGDKVLQVVSKRFQSRLQSTDVVARIGGDEFAVIVRSIPNREVAFSIASRIMSCLSERVEVNGVSVTVGASIGISFFPQDGKTVDTLIRNADEAMHRAKENGKGEIVCFDQSMADETQRRFQIERDLRIAINTNQFILHFQPQVNTETGAVNSVEALIRWIHPERGFIPPFEFISVAEEARLINKIGAWVLEEAVRQLDAWRNGPLKGVRVGVNIAASQFILEDFAERTLQLLEQNNVSPTLLEIEVTESIVMNELQVVLSNLNTLRAAGVRVAVDDFGTGYSSLSYLQDLPLDVLKIDRAFINRLENEDISESVANTIMLLADGLGLETVAEGVETAVQFEQVRTLGCTTIQGYYFAKPCDAESLERSIAEINTKFSNNHLRAA